MFTAAIRFLMSGGTDVMTGRDRIPRRAFLEHGILVDKIIVS